MSTRSSARNLFPPFDNPVLTIQRRSRADPTLLNDFEMAVEGNNDPPVPDLRTMEELCQPSLNGRGGPIAPIAIQATNFGLKNDMIQQVQNSCQFHDLPGDDANKHLDKFLHVTQSIKVNGVTDDALCLYLFPHSLTHHATTWFNRLPRNSINIFEQMAKMFLGKYFPPSMVTKLINEITNFCQRPDESLFEAWEHYKLSIDRSLKAKMVEINKNLMRVLQVNQQVKAVTPNCETYGGPYSYTDCPATIGQTQNVYVAGPIKIPQLQVVTTNEFTNFMKANDVIVKNMQTNMTSLTDSNLELKNMFGQFMKMNTATSLGSRTLPSNTITNPKEDLKGITTRSGTAYQRPAILTTFSSLPKVAERETEVKKDTVHPTNNGSTKDIQPLVVQAKTPILNSKPVVAPVSALKPNLKPSIPYPSRLNGQKLRDKANDQKEKFFQIFQDLNFNISFADTLILMPKFSPTIKTLLTNKDKLSELSRTPLNEHCSAILLKKLPLKLRDPGNRGHRRCLRQSRNVPFLVQLRELTLRVGKEAITFNLDQTSRYSANYNDMTTNRIDVIDMACEEYSQEVLGFSDVIASGNPTPYYDPIISTSSPTLTPFEDTDFLLGEVDAFLALEDDPTSPEVDHSYFDPEGDILLLEAFLNDDPSLPPPHQGNYLPQVHKELKIYEAKYDKSFIDKPPEVELKDLPPHLEYKFLKGKDKLPVIIVKDLSDEEKTTLITVLKSHKQAIAWKLSDIKGINPEFCTHKILMEEDFKPAVQHLRKVNPKIHDVIKKEVEKLLDAGLIYPISYSPWVSLVHYVPKKGGFTVVEDEENELIPTRLVTGWCVCIDYQKLNEATHKDHFPLPFIDQILERLAGNEYYCFLDGFSSYIQIPIDLKDQEKTTFTCPYGTFAYCCMPFGLCNAPVFRNSFQTCLSHLEKMLKQCEDTNLCLNWEKSHFMVKEGIVLGHKISKDIIEVDKSKVKVIAKLPHPTTVKGILSFLGHAGFYRRLIKDDVERAS
uniref:Reverse transcriptase domain-containing protein n=1 Tax=Tanacetum cinerariifolium TaxID=118510 RepID=A0A699IHU4_TANCI|nr:reverse transcriptase domain-containing protein [Tanacetum cinerariifolium]